MATTAGLDDQIHVVGDVACIRGGGSLVFVVDGVVDNEVVTTSGVVSVRCRSRITTTTTSDFLLWPFTGVDAVAVTVVLSTVCHDWGSTFNTEKNDVVFVGVFRVCSFWFDRQ